MKILGKNQLTILVISLMLITAGYLNYSTEIKNNTEEVSAQTEEENIELAAIGDATLVNSDDVIETNAENNNEELNQSGNGTVETVAKKEENKDDEYFITSKLEREKMYSQMLETYQKILENSNISEEQKGIATTEINRINNTKNSIMIAENLITLKGFKNNIIFVNDNSISVIIQAEEINQEEIAQIQNIIARELKADIEDIHISKK